MSVIEKALAAVLKDISTAFYMISAVLALGSLKKYSTTKANYFYDKIGEDIKE